MFRALGVIPSIEKVNSDCQIECIQDERCWWYIMILKKKEDVTVGDFKTVY